MRCEGQTKESLALPKTLIIVKEGKWVQCENEAVMKITVIQDGNTRIFPVCETCYELTREHGIKILAQETLLADVIDYIGKETEELAMLYSGLKNNENQS